MKHGYGEWKKTQNSPKCNRFEGYYQLDKKNGQGTFTWESGNIFTGNYLNDEREGYGEMYWTDGSVYKGDWKKGIQHGKGIMTFPDGRIKDGMFENNIFKGAIKVQEGSHLEQTINQSININRCSVLSNPNLDQAHSQFNQSLDLGSEINRQLEQTSDANVRQAREMQIKTRGANRSLERVQ